MTSHFYLFMTLVGVLIITPARADYNNLDVRGTGEAYYLGFIKVYDAALYVENTVDSSDILDADVSRCLKLDYAVSLSTSDFVRGAETVLKRQYTEQELESVRQNIDLLHRSYRDVDSGDTYTLCYDAASQATTLSLNTFPLVTIASPDFAKVYFGIWLGPHKALDDTLRKNLLAVNSNR